MYKHFIPILRLMTIVILTACVMLRPEGLLAGEADTEESPDKKTNESIMKAARPRAAVTGFKLKVDGYANVGGTDTWQSPENKGIYFGDEDYVYVGEKDGDDILTIRAGTFYFENSNTVSHEGNVGIVTSSPSETLEVSGKVKATHFIGDGSNLTDVGPSSWDWAEFTGGVYRLDSVGIGSAGANSKLQVNGSLSLPVKTVTANYTPGDNDYTILCNAQTTGFIITIPTAVGKTGRIYVIKKIDDQNTTIDINAASGETIEGDTNIGSHTGRFSLMIQSDGTSWHILSYYNGPF